MPVALQSSNMLQLGLGHIWLPKRDDCLVPPERLRWAGVVPTEAYPTWTLQKSKAGVLEGSEGRVLIVSQVQHTSSVSTSCRKDLSANTSLPLRNMIRNNLKAAGIQNNRHQIVNLRSFKKTADPLSISKRCFLNMGYSWIFPGYSMVFHDIPWYSKYCKWWVMSVPNECPYRPSQSRHWCLPELVQEGERPSSEEACVVRPAALRSLDQLACLVTNNSG